MNKLSGIKTFSNYMAAVVSVFLCLVCTAAEDIPQKTISIRAEEWQGLTNVDGSGYFFEVIKAVYEPLGYQLTFKFCPWLRCMLEIIDGRADIIIAISDHETGIKNRLQTSRYPIHLEKVGAAFKRGRWPDWQGQKTMEGKMIVQSRGYGRQRNLDVPVNVLEVSTIDQAWRVLMADRVDFYLAGLTLLKRLARDYDNSGALFRVEPIYEEEEYLGFNYSEKGSQLRREFDRRLPQLYESGEIEKLQGKWNYPWPIPL